MKRTILAAIMVLAFTGTAQAEKFICTHTHQVQCTNFETLKCDPGVGAFGMDAKPLDARIDAPIARVQDDLILGGMQTSHVSRERISSGGRDRKSSAQSYWGTRKLEAILRNRTNLGSAPGRYNSNLQECHAVSC
jgi:hypothetical protein